MIAKADTLYTWTLKLDMLIPPFFFIAIPKNLIHPGDPYTNKEAMFGHFYQNAQGNMCFSDLWGIGREIQIG